MAGRKQRRMGGLSQLTQFEIEDLPTLGWIRILWVGEENIYFAFGAGGLRGFCKANA